MLSNEKPVVSVVLGSYNRCGFLRAAVDSVRGNDICVPYEMIVVDGGSTDGSIDWLTRQSDVITIVQHNRGEFQGRPIRHQSWGYFMNLAFRAAHGTYVVMISDDCLVLPGAINRGIERFERLTREGRRIGAAAFYYRDWPHERDYYVQLTLGGKLMVNHGMYSRLVLEEVGWVDEDRYIFYKADGDLSLKIWKGGYEIVDCPGAYVEHHAHAAPDVRDTNNATLEHDRQAYLERWTGIYYHPEQPDQRRRLSVSFDDPTRMAERFPAAAQQTAFPT